MVALTVKNGNDRLKKGIGDAEQKFGLLDTAFWRSDHNPASLNNCLLFVIKAVT